MSLRKAIAPSAAAWLALTASILGQDVPGPDFHEFTDKKGQKISATLLGVTEDRQRMRIRRGDGQEFETAVNLLSLDDQQYVKDWLKTNEPRLMPDAAAAVSDYRLEVQISRAPGEKVSRRDDYYTMEGTEDRFRIVVRNLSRDVLVGAKVEYAVVWRDGVAVYYHETREAWTYTYSSGETDSELVKQRGEIALPEVRFNDQGVVETAPFRLERVLYDGNQLYREDVLVGVKLRVRDASGRILQEVDSGGAEIAAMSWESVGGLVDPEATVVARRSAR